MALISLMVALTACKKPEPLKFATMEITFTGDIPISSGYLSVIDELSPYGYSNVGTIGIIEVGGVYSAPLKLHEDYTIVLVTSDTEGSTQEVTVSVSYNGDVKTTILDLHWTPEYLRSTGQISSEF